MRSSGVEHAGAIADLRAYVLRAALYSFKRSRGNLGRMASTEINQLAEDDHQLSARQRQALKAILFDGVPLDEVVRHWGRIATRCTNCSMMRAVSSRRTWRNGASA